MTRRRGEDDGNTQLHTRTLEPRGDGSADAIFRSFVQRANGSPLVPVDAVSVDEHEASASTEITPADGVSLVDVDEDAPVEASAAAEAADPGADPASDAASDLEPTRGDATDPRIPARWTETVELLLEQGRTEIDRPTLSRQHDMPTRLTPIDGVMLLTARKTAPPGTRAHSPLDDDDDEPSTVAVRAGGLIERLRAAGPPEHTVAYPRMPELVRTVVHPRPLEHARILDAQVSGSTARRLDRLPPEDDLVEDAPRTGERPRQGSGATRTRVEPPSEPIELRTKAPSRPPRGSTPPEAPTQDSAEPGEPWQSVVQAPSETTQRREAMRLVPDVAHVAVRAEPPSERSEDGLIPSGLLDRKLSDMAVLLRYGHEAQVRHELEQLRSRYAQDLLLARRIAEFYLTHERPALALEQLFSLATGLFERRNVEGMRQALEQVLVVEPGNERAQRLLGLLEQRPSEPPHPPGRKQR